MIAKIFFGITLLALAVCGFSAYTLNGKTATADASRAKTESNISATEAEINKLENSIADFKKTYTAKEAEKKEIADKTEAANNNLSEVKRKAEALTSQVREASDRANAAEKDLQDKVAKYGETKPEEHQREIQALTDKVTSASNEAKVLEQKEKTNIEDTEKLRKATAIAAQGGPIPGVNGKVIDVNRTWNYATVNLGTHDGVAPNGVLHVYRGRTFIGKLRIISVEAHRATANVLREESSREIQVGDQIVN
ncbi:hypothetical protein DB346_12325 [Verrucomicrobia bacterium LW23]|nr:hypothetical protein DB346_12325 [Verrucomicrobia bacterium LW23]